MAKTSATAAMVTNDRVGSAIHRLKRIAPYSLSRTAAQKTGSE